MSKTKDNRARAWTFLVYPESCEKNWREIIDAMHIAWVVSPLHDKDKYLDDVYYDKDTVVEGKLHKKGSLKHKRGTNKPAHWHVVLLFEGKKSYEQVLEISKKVKGTKLVQRVQSVRGMIRYLIHMDNPEKHLYRKEDVEVHGGADIAKYFELTGNSREQILDEIIDYVQGNEITSLSKLVYHARQYPELGWLDVIANHNTAFLSLLLKSIWQDQKNSEAYDDEDDVVDEEISNHERIKASVKRMHMQGRTQKVIADTLGLSTRTIRNYLIEIKADKRVKRGKKRK